MSSVNQVVAFLYLMLLLQAFNCINKEKHENALTAQAFSILAGKKKEAEDQTDLYDEGYWFGDEGDASDNEGDASDHKDAEGIEYDSFVEFDFEKQIETFRLEADKARGIHSKVEGGKFIRVVQDSASSLFTVEDYMVQILNILRAVKAICKLYEYKAGDATVSQMAYKLLSAYYKCSEAPESFWRRKVEAYNKQAVRLLKEKIFPDEDLDSINTKLRLVENYVGLNDTQYDVTTTFTIGGKKFELEDKKWLKLTETQKSEFINRKSEKWYMRLTPFEKKLLDAYLDKFLDGAHYIPTQIRNIPGCRNAYQKSVLAYDENNNATVLGRYYHSGALASLVADNDETIAQPITKQNWQQIQQHVKDIEVLSLNHNTDYWNMSWLKPFAEKHIVEPTKDTVGNMQFINLPIGHIGKLKTPMFKDQVNKLVEESANFYNGKYPELCNAFIDNNNMGRQKHIEQIEVPKDKCYFQGLETLKAAAEKADSHNMCIQNCSQLHCDNYYANIAGTYTACRAVFDQTRPGTTTLVCCKSGKDRTGLISLVADAHSIHMTQAGLGLDSALVNKALACSGHYQFLASCNGGMPGRFGMKYLPLTKEFSNYRTQLFSKSAESTEIPLK